MELDIYEIEDIVKKEFKGKIFKYFLVEIIWFIGFFINMQLIIKNKWYFCIIPIILLDVISKRIYLNIARDTKLFYIDKNTLFMTTEKFIWYEYVLTFMLVYLIYRYNLGYISLFILDTYIKLKRSIVYRKLKGENTENNNRIACPAFNFIPSYNFDAKDYTTVNTQTKINENGEYEINLYDTDLTVKKDNKKEEEEEKQNIDFNTYLEKVKYLYENPNENLDTIHSKFKGIY